MFLPESVKEKTTTIKGKMIDIRVFSSTIDHKHKY